MDNEELKNWRVSVMGFTISEAAHELGISTRTYENYERGFRYMGKGRTREVKIPKSVILACSAIEAGENYTGKEID